MSKNTYEARLTAGLIARGWTIDASDRSHYTAFVKEGQRNKLFVGTNGALRKGECASRSFSIGDAARQTPIYLEVLAMGDIRLGQTQTSSRVDLTPYA